MGNKIKLILVDDHRLFGEGLRSLLAEENQFELLAMAKNGREAIPLIDSYLPDIVLTDLEMPELDGADLIKYLKKNHPNIKILVLSMHRETPIIKSIIQLGIDGFILKDAHSEELSKAILEIAKGEKYFSAEVMKVLALYLNKANQKNYSELSSREMEILQLIANELTTNEIAQKLNLSQLTVETHRKNILLKLGVRNTAGLIKYALNKGWIE
jgi:DNA-binding NarL/FixJ family response regulator